jgi:hypothetical protein
MMSDHGGPDDACESVRIGLAATTLTEPSTSGFVASGCETRLATPVVVVTDTLRPGTTVVLVAIPVSLFPRSTRFPVGSCGTTVGEGGGATFGVLFGASVAGGLAAAVDGGALAGARRLAGAKVGTPEPFVPETFVSPNVHNSTSPGCGTSLVAPVEL